MYFILLLMFTNAWGGEVVENGLTPKGKPQTMVFERELRIGPEAEVDHHIWSGASVMVEVNKAGDIFILDRGSLRIIQMDAKGNLIRSFGKEGEGPGEFKRLTNLCLLQDQSIVATESRRGLTLINYFDAQGKFLRRTNTTEMAKQFTSSKVSPNGDWIAVTYYRLKKDGSGQEMGYAVLDHKGDIQVNLGQHDMPAADLNRLTDPNFWSEYMGAWFALQPDQGLVEFNPSGQVFTTISNRYQITRYSPDLKQKLTFTRKYRPRPQTPEDQVLLIEPIRERVLANVPGNIHQYITEAAVLKALELAELPEVQSPILGLIPMEDGGVIAVVNFNPKTGKAQGDIFDKRGVFLGTCDLPDPEIDPFGGYNNLTVKMIFRYGKVYTIEDVNGDYYLNRYSYKLQPVK